MNWTKGRVVLIITTSLFVTGIIRYWKEQNQLSSPHDITVTYNHRSKHISALYNPTTYLRLQQLFYSKQQEEKAKPLVRRIDLYNHTLMAIPKISKTLTRMSALYANQAYHDQATAAYKATVALNPSNASTLILQRL